MRGSHGREAFYIAGEGMRCLAQDGGTQAWVADAIQEATEFRFSRFVPGLRGQPNSDELLAQLAVAMTSAGRGRLDRGMPAGYTYLGQFVDHDMTRDPTELNLAAIGLDDLLSKRSPTLDLDSLYGKGPQAEPQYYAADGVHLLTGRPFDVTGGNAAGDGFDLPRRGPAADGERRTEREAKIPDIRNDENLAVAQVHAAFIRLHNRVVDGLVDRSVPSALLFDRARAIVTRHYHWMLVHDYLPRLCDPAVVHDVFTNGRRIFEAQNAPRFGTMPVEFSGAAFRLGHSMIRTGYEWNKIFNGKPGALDTGHLFRLFRFSGTSGTLMPVAHAPGSPEDLADLENPPPLQPGSPLGRALPSNWVADMTRLFDFSRFAADDPAFVPMPEDFNHAAAIDSHLVDPLALLPMGSFGATQTPLLKKRNLAFRNLVRGRMLGLPSGQQLAAAFSAQGVPVSALTEAQLRSGPQGQAGADLSQVQAAQMPELLAHTPLWFYILREAEHHGNKLAGVGARIVAETFHRAIQASTHSMLSEPGFKPTLGPGRDVGRCNMEDLLHFAFEGRADLLSPLP